MMNEATLNIWRDLLRQIPVAVNNFYGDPIIQWSDTVASLKELAHSGHTGPVGIITKGRLCPRHLEDLKSFRAAGLRLIVMVSISELTSLEGVGSEHRYENIRLLADAGVPVVAAVRPLMPPYNTTEEKLRKIFSGVAAAGRGCCPIVISGFRGDEALVEAMSPDQRTEWALRVKVMPGEVYSHCRDLAREYGAQMFTRTACAVAAVLGEERAYNPYYNSPNLVKCEELACPLRATCQGPSRPRPGSLELLRYLGYEVEFVPASGHGLCKVSGENRLRCPSCCTTCWREPEVAHISVEGNVRLGDLAFIRFVSGVMATQYGRNDDGDKEVGKITFPAFPEIGGIQGLNSWWPISRNIERCYGCKYCIVDTYYNQNEIGRRVGFAPALLIDKLAEVEAARK
jgi:hypothetical protein